MPKALAPKDLVKVVEGEERIVLPPWDPMVCSVLGFCKISQTHNLYDFFPGFSGMILACNLRPCF